MFYLDIKTNKLILTYEGINSNYALKFLNAPFAVRIYSLLKLAQY